MVHISGFQMEEGNC